MLWPCRRNVCYTLIMELSFTLFFKHIKEFKSQNSARNISLKKSSYRNNFQYGGSACSF